MRAPREITDVPEDELVRELDCEIHEDDAAYDLFVSDREKFRPKFWVKTRPRVYLVGGTAMYDNQVRRFQWEHGVADWTSDAHSGKAALTEVAGRLCYWSFPNPRPGGHEAYVKRILSEGHGSVIEHAVFHFIITGVSRSFTHELVRHRIASYSQLSQRFFSEEGCTFVMPPKVADDPRSRDAWLRCVESAYDGYMELMEYLPERYTDITCDDAREQQTLRRKAARGESRSVLPNCTETKILVTMNARSLRHFIEMRASRQADQEIRRVAYAMFELARDDSPSLFMDYVEDRAPGLGRFVTTPYRKV